MTIEYKDKKIQVLLSWEDGEFPLQLESWAQLPQRKDVILHPDQRYNPVDDRLWEVNRRIYRTVRDSSTGKTEVQDVVLFCDFHDPQGKGLKPFSSLDSNPNPQHQVIHPEHAEAIVEELQRLARQAIAKNDWSEVFLFLSFRVPSWV